VRDKFGGQDHGQAACVPVADANTRRPCARRYAQAFCKHCGDEHGALKGYDEVLAGRAGFLRRMQGFDEKVALAPAKRMMAKLPAWSGR